MVKISPSVLNSDLLTLADDIKVLEKAGADMLHIDVMDGIFVPNMSFGVPVIKSIKAHTKLPLDVHLMIDRPHRYIEEFAKYSDYLGFHYEAGSDNIQTLKKIRELGCKAYITVKPKTPIEAVYDLLEYCDMVLVMSVEPGFGGQKFIPETLERLKKLSCECKKRNLNIEIEVDGGINGETAKPAADAGATVLVAGSYVFAAHDMEKAVKTVKGV